MPLGQDLGIDLGVRLRLDAVAELGINEWRGTGRVRHLDIAALCFQKEELRRDIDMRKVSGPWNPAILLQHNGPETKVTSVVHY